MHESRKGSVLVSLRIAFVLHDHAKINHAILVLHFYEPIRLFIHLYSQVFSLCCWRSTEPIEKSDTEQGCFPEQRQPRTAGRIPLRPLTVGLERERQMVLQWVKWSSYTSRASITFTFTCILPHWEDHMRLRILCLSLADFYLQWMYSNSINDNHEILHHVKFTIRLVSFQRTYLHIHIIIHSHSLTVTLPFM